MESINERRLSDKKDERRDLLSNLVNANEEFLEDGEQRLGEAELVGAGSTLGLQAGSFTHLPSRKHVHVLPRWTRGEDTLDGTQGRFDFNGVIDDWTHPCLRPEHARGASRRTRGVVPTHSRSSPG